MNTEAKCEWCGEPADDEQGPLVNGMHSGCAESERSGAMATVLNGMTIVASAGHAEYWVDDTSIPGLVITDVWPPADIDDVYEAFPDDGMIEAAYAAAVLNGPDVDPYWEHVVSWNGDRAAIEAGLTTLLEEVGVAPSGDDDTFDYWPSGCRYALSIAARLDDEWVAKVEEIVRTVIVGMDDFADELFDKVGIERNTNPKKEA
jgi:hypothetical protein